MLIHWPFLSQWIHRRERDGHQESWSPLLWVICYKYPQTYSWSTCDKERQIIHDIVYMQILKKWYKWWRVKVLVTQSCLTLRDPMDCSPPGSSVYGILQARILEWVAMPFSRGSSWPRNWTQVSWIAGRFFTIWATREAQFTKQKQTYRLREQTFGYWGWGRVERRKRLRVCDWHVHIAILKIKCLSMKKILYLSRDFILEAELLRYTGMFMTERVGGLRDLQ